MARVLRSGSKRLGGRVESMFSGKGAGFRRLAESQAANVAGDTLVAIALAGTLFFSVPSSQARGNVFLYLLITLAPFAIIGPFLGVVFERFPGAYRSGLVVSSLGRAVVVGFMVAALDTLLLYPLAFVLLVLSRLHGISRSAVLPVVLGGPEELIAANAQLARLGVLASAVVAPVGALGVWAFGPWVALVLGAATFVYSGVAASGLPPVRFEHARPVGAAKPQRGLNHSVRLARFATAGVRFLNGFLLLLVAFAFRDVDAGVLDFGAILAAGGVGYFVAAMISPVLERRLAEEPMVVIALAIEAGAAFLAVPGFGLPAAALLAGAAGLSWGTAKFGFDGLLQATVEAEHRGRAFARSETLFQATWVIGSAIPVAITIHTEAGLIAAGLVALGVQVLYVSAVLLPIAEARRSELRAEPRGDITDILG